jgi:urease accessory protein
MTASEQRAGALADSLGGADRARTDAGLLGALQLGDSLFPSGGFTLSHGLETLADRKLVTGAESLHRWIARTVRWQVAPSDGVAAAAAWAAREDLAAVADIDRYLFASKLAREPREASERTGRQMLASLTTIVGGPLTSYRAEVLAGRGRGLQPIVVGLAGGHLGLSQRDTVLLLLHLHVSGCLGAAMRLIEVDDIEAQQIRLALVPVLSAAADEALTLDWREMYTGAMQTELMAMLHESSTMRLFAT